MGSGTMLAILLLRYVSWIYLANTYKLINESIPELLRIKPYNSWACSWTNFVAWA